MDEYITFDTDEELDHPTPQTFRAVVNDKIFIRFITKYLKDLKKHKAVLGPLLFIHERDVPNVLLKKYTIIFDRDCNHCSLRNQPGGCENCIGKIWCYRKFIVNKTTIYGFNRGDLGLLYKYIEVPILNKTTKAHLKEYTLKFNTKILRDDQTKAVKNWLKKCYGQIQAPARTGKTLIIAAITCKLNRKTIIIARQEDLLDQFYQTFVGKVKEGPYKGEYFTNIADIERQLGRPIIGVVKNRKDIEKYDIVLTTYQKFIANIKGWKKFSKISKRFGFAAFDEAHQTAAKLYSKVAGSINADIICSCTATPKRKDQRHLVVNKVLGPVTVKVKRAQISCKVYYVHTNVNIPNMVRYFTTIITKLTASKTRNKLLGKYAVKDVEAGHKVLIVVERVEHARQLAVDITKQHGLRTAALFGKAQMRKALLEEIRKGGIDVTIATRKLMTGLDVPIWSAYYCAMPMNNGPNYYQEFSRVRTPMQGKKDPIIRYFVDKGNSVFYACRNMSHREHVKEGFEEFNEYPGAEPISYTQRPSFFNKRFIGKR